MAPEIISIMAMASNRVIGRGQTIPWHLPGEQQHFKNTTWGYPVIMGRKTYESIGRPLAGRRNIVISGNRNFAAAGCEVVPNLEAALALCGGVAKIFIIGGREIFIQALPYTDTVILTTICREAEGDIVLPPFEHDFIKIKQDMITDPEPYLIEIYHRIRRAPRAPANQAD